MSAPGNGGPAFPFIDSASPLEHPGMTLRDYFAAKAMQAVAHDAEVFWDKAAPLAYQYADAMLKARSA